MLISRSYDKDGFSIWRVDFKYNEELTQTFMSNNQVGPALAYGTMLTRPRSEASSTVSRRPANISLGLWESSARPTTRSSLVLSSAEERTSSPSWTLRLIVSTPPAMLCLVANERLCQRREWSR